MPEVFKRYGFVFFFYSKEHEPIHIHVEGEGGLVIFDLIENEFVLRKQIGKIKASSIRKIERTLIEEKQLIINSWNKHFGYYEEDEL